MNSNLKIFGIGLNKTGTTTLAKCLEMLGFEKHLSCRNDLLEKYRLGNIEEVLKVADDYRTFEDWPWPLIYKELYDRYRESALFILTVRKSPDKWVESLKNHSLRTHPVHHSRRLAYGYDYPHGFEEEHKLMYENHNVEVRHFFQTRGAGHQLLELCWEAGDGWKKLCEFLALPVPDVPLPHENSGEAPGVNEDFYRKNQLNIQRQLDKASGRGEGIPT